MRAVKWFFLAVVTLGMFWAGMVREMSRPAQVSFGQSAQERRTATGEQQTPFSLYPGARLVMMETVNIGGSDLRIALAKTPDAIPAVIRYYENHFRSRGLETYPVQQEGESALGVLNSQTGEFWSLSARRSGAETEIYAAATRLLSKKTSPSGQRPSLPLPPETMILSSLGNLESPKGQAHLLFNSSSASGNDRYFSRTLGQQGWTEESPPTLKKPGWRFFARGRRQCHILLQEAPQLGGSMILLVEGEEN